MPVVTDDEDLPLVPRDTPNLVINPTPYVSQVVDTRREQYDAVATFVSGSKWACDYYRQVQGRDSAAASFQMDLPFAFGQYEEIKGFELIVTNPLTAQQNGSDSRGWNMAGSGVVYSCVTPNAGDVFVADIGNGKNALFQVMSTQRLSVWQESGTTIEYRAIWEMDKEKTTVLKSKVVETWYFSRENLRNGLKPLVQQEEMDLLRRLDNAERRLIGLYFRDFFDEGHKSLLVPGQLGPTYDPFLTTYVKHTLDERQHPRLNQVTVFGMGSDVYHDQTSLFDALLHRDGELLYSCSQRMGVADIRHYYTRPLMRSIYYSGVKGVVTPKDPKWNADSRGFEGHPILDFAEGMNFRQDEIENVLPHLDLTQEQPIPEIPLIHPVLKDDYYVFTQAFYDDTEGQSVLENLVRDRLAGRTISLQDLAAVADKAHTFGNLERFYYTPIILTLIKLAPGVL